LIVFLHHNWKKEESKMKSIGKIVGTVFLGALLVFGAVLARRFFVQPLAEPLAIETHPQQEATQSLSDSSGDETAEGAAPTAVPAGLCGNTGKIQILLTGADYSIGMPPLGADAIRLIQIDFDEPEIITVAFPRAMVVDTEALDIPLKNLMELGTSYYEKKQSAQGTNIEKVSEATTLLAQVLYDNFEVEPNNYITLQLDSVGAMIDEIGGVEITLAEEITTERKVTFPAGTQTLNGRLAAEFVRSRKPGGEAARLKRQELFMDAFQKKIFSASVVKEIPDLLSQFQGAIVTDLSVEQLLSLACAYQEIPEESQTYINLMGDEYVTVNEEGTMIPKAEEIKDLLEEISKK
jgi:LCP family protein required for cell wall assembly